MNCDLCHTSNTLLWGGLCASCNITPPRSGPDPGRYVDEIDANGKKKGTWFLPLMPGTPDPATFPANCASCKKLAESAAGTKCWRHK